MPSVSPDITDDDPNSGRPLSPSRRTRSNPAFPRNTSFLNSPAAVRLFYASANSPSPASSSSSLSSWFGLAPDSGRSTPKKRTWRVWFHRHLGLFLITAFVLVFFLVNSWMFLRILDSGQPDSGVIKLEYLETNASTASIVEELLKLDTGNNPHKTIYARLLRKAAHALAEGFDKPEPEDLWEEPYLRASSWKPCADQRDWNPKEGNDGYIMVTANGGINQQRVAICNAVAVARLLNATLVLPELMYSSVWRDTSQFGDIYQEDYFINYLKPDIQIVKELPKELQSLDLDAIGSVVSDADIMKEAKPVFYKSHIRPILLRNRVVHFIGFGNRLAADPIPFEVQRLRCRCNFHALRFVPKLQETGALLVQRMRQNVTRLGQVDDQLLGSFVKMENKTQKPQAIKDSKYLALHLRFEIDMVAHSLCEFGGGSAEQQELEAYRREHFPGLVEIAKPKRIPSPEALRAEGLCPLMPEETVLMLAGLGFNFGTRIYLAGAHIYGGKTRLTALTTLFPNLVTKENLLSSTEIEPFRNSSSWLAVLDFIVCTAADMFAMTDSGSQFSSLVSGYRIYYGGGKMPTIRPNKRRLADIFARNKSIEWNVFELRVRKAIRQSKRVFSRPLGRNVYRYPRCEECMCNTDVLLTYM